VSKPTYKKNRFFLGGGGGGVISFRLIIDATDRDFVFERVLTASG